MKFRYYRVRSLWWGRILSRELFFFGGALFQAPVKFRGKGNISIGDCVKFGYNAAPRLGDGELLFQARDDGSVISIGERTAFSNNVSLIARKSIRIGDDCLIGECVQIVDSDFHGISAEERHSSSGESDEVIIGNNVWLGSRVIVMKGSRIGDNSVIGAGSIVVGSVPSGVIACGTPARVVREL